MLKAVCKQSSTVVSLKHSGACWSKDSAFWNISHRTDQFDKDVVNAISLSCTLEWGGGGGGAKNHEVMYMIGLQGWVGGGLLL